MRKSPLSVFRKESSSGGEGSASAASPNSLRQPMSSGLEHNPILAPPSPGTPPTKVWEKHYRSFLRKNHPAAQRQRESPPTELGGKPPASPTSEGLPPPPNLATSGNQQRKFFPLLRRKSIDKSDSNEGQKDRTENSRERRRRVKSFTNVDELDQTRKKGSTKAVSTNIDDSKDTDAHSSSGSGPTIRASLSHNDLADPSLYLIEEPDTRETAFQPGTFFIPPAILRQSNGMNGNITTLEGLPALIAPATGIHQVYGMNQQSALSSAIDQRFSVIPSVTPARFADLLADDDNDDDIAVGSASATKSSLPPTPSSAFRIKSVTPSAMKKAFTEFHNSSQFGMDSMSAFLGTSQSPAASRGVIHPCNNADPTTSTLQLGKSLQPPSRLASSFSETALSSCHPSPALLAATSGVLDQTGGPLKSLDDWQVGRSRRVLRDFCGSETWQTGRRYTIGQAALAACPPWVRQSLWEQCVPLDDASTDPFHQPILLGSCFLSQVRGPAELASNEWSLASLVLYNNYLLEFSPETITSASKKNDNGMLISPRGYALLVGGSCKLHAFLSDVLELHFFGSPCVTADARVVFIRVLHEKDRLRWCTCLDNAAGLSVEMLYEYDKEPLGKGVYSNVYAGRRKRRSSISTDDTITESRYNRAFKIFEKTKFWRCVANGRERADTIVREVAVQTTLTVHTTGERDSLFVKALGFFETPEHVVLEMELVNGYVLFDYISEKCQGVLPEHRAARIMSYLLQGIDTMNSLGVAHRDIKPANVFVCGKDTDESIRVKIGDFGMAAFLGENGTIQGRCGTPGYVSPEIFSAKHGYSNNVDVFSAGVTLYVMLCGYEPFYGETDAELVKANEEADVEFDRDEWKNVSSEAQEMILQLLRKNPVDRPNAAQASKHVWLTG